MFSVNLTYVVVALYGWALKVFYVPTAYKEVFGQLYPARYSLANLFMMQVHCAILWLESRNRG